MKILIDNGHGKSNVILISRLLEANATQADRAAHIDLADWLLKYLEGNNL